MDEIKRNGNAGINPEEEFGKALEMFGYGNLIDLSEYRSHLKAGKRAYMDVAFLVSQKIPYLYENEVTDFYIGQSEVVLKHEGYEIIRRYPVEKRGNVGDIEMKRRRLVLLCRGMSRDGVYIDDIHESRISPMKTVEEINEKIEGLMSVLRADGMRIDEVRILWSDSDEPIRFEYGNGAYDIPRSEIK